MPAEIDDDLAQNEKNQKMRRVLEVISDAFAFVRSAESNAALATVTLEQLINDQILRNGETAKSKANQFTPYNYDDKETPAGEAAVLVNTAGGSDTTRPTKIDFILAVQNELSAVIEEIKANPSTVEDYTEALEHGYAEEDVTESEE
jgi:hypothetical protein